MTSTLEKALPFVLKHEGGWSDNPADPGGATMHGVTQAVAQKHGIMTKDALKAITPTQVESIYRSDYWRFDGIDDQRVATKIFDMAVNFGPKAAISMVQDALNDIGAYLNPDGVYGPKTEAAINAVHPIEMLTMLRNESEYRYRSIVASRPESAQFLPGWLRRAQEIPV
ncbi:MAG: glycosyl hydrolase 108 family protein [Bryobacteraceae bacterium]